MRGVLIALTIIIIVFALAVRSKLEPINFDNEWILSPS